MLSLSNGLLVIIVGATLIKDTGTIIEGESFAVTSNDYVLIQSSIAPTTKNADFNTFPPLFCSSFEWTWWRFVCINPIHLVTPKVGIISTMNAEEVDKGPQILEQRYSCVAACQEHYFRDPPNIERGYGAHLYDCNGRAYLDMLNNVAVVGHCHPKVTKMAA